MEYSALRNNELIFKYFYSTKSSTYICRKLRKFSSAKVLIQQWKKDKITEN